MDKYINDIRINFNKIILLNQIFSNKFWKIYYILIIIIYYKYIYLYNQRNKQRTIYSFFNCI